jgi:hypothetical protein
LVLNPKKSYADVVRSSPSQKSALNCSVFLRLSYPKNYQDNFVDYVPDFNKKIERIPPKLSESSKSANLSKSSKRVLRWVPKEQGVKKALDQAKLAPSCL